MSPPLYLKVVFPVPSQGAYTYLAPPDWSPEVGWLVLAPLGRSSRVGVVWEILLENDCLDHTVRSIQGVLGETAILDEGQLRFLSWMARYYMQPLGAAAAVALPSHLLRYEKRRRVMPLAVSPQTLARLTAEDQAIVAAMAGREKGLEMSTLASLVGGRGLAARLTRLAAKNIVAVEDRWCCRQLRPLAPPKTPLPPAQAAFLLSEEQQQCLTPLLTALEEHTYTGFLLEGITGSGKTELYLRAAARCLELGRQVLILSPEIALTPQMAGRFHARFPGELALFHSGLTDGQRYRHWLRVKSGEARVVVGARSALFAPFVTLGLVVVDEEHDSSYKQDEGSMPYQGRDMAVLLSRQWQAVLLLGSATPSMESLHNVSLGKYRSLHLTKRATGAPLPTVTLIDLRQAVKAGDMNPNSLISPQLRQGMADTLALGRQVLLYLDRRGYAPALLCVRCGQAMGCPHCSVSLTYHRDPPRLVCHYCAHVALVPTYCPTCGQMSFSHFGPGTERLEKKVREYFPDSRVARLDRDVVVAGGPGTLQNILATFEAGELDILVGTRMIAKGHHFPKLSLVGVILAETGLFHPDFRAAERTFQAVTQVAGRAGREDSPGQVLVQSYDPGHYALTSALAHDVGGFVARETPSRQMAGYPPYSRLALLRYFCQEQEEGWRMQKMLRNRWPVTAGEGQVWGPAQAHLFRLRGWYRWQILVKNFGEGNLHSLVAKVHGCIVREAGTGVRVTVDIDPYDFLS